MKKFLSMILALATVLSLNTMAFAKDFTDVKEENLNYEAIEVLSTLNIINGYDKDNFGPNDKLTRSQLCAMLVRAMYEEDHFVLTEDSFKDVPFYHWAKMYIDTASANGLMNGYNENTFGPDDRLTYTQTARVILNALGYGELDWPIGVNTVAYSLNLYHNITGVKFDDTCTRAHAAQMIYNAFDADIMKLYAGQYFVTDKNFLNDVLGFKEESTESTEGKDAGHEYLSFENIRDKKDDNDYVTNIRLTDEDILYPRRNGTYYSFYEKGGKEYKIDWNAVSIYRDEKILSSGQAVAIDKMKSVTGIFNKHNELVAIYFETPGVNYIPGKHDNLPSKVLRDPTYDEDTSTVTYWSSSKAYEISNKVEEGTITRIKWNDTDKQWDVEIDHRIDFTINEKTPYIGSELNSGTDKKKDIVIYFDYNDEIAGYKIVED